MTLDFLQESATKQESLEVLTIHVIKRNGKYSARSEERREANGNGHSTYTGSFASALSAARDCIDRIESFGRPRGPGRRPRG
jgi:hypothetical protein